MDDPFSLQFALAFLCLVMAPIIGLVFASPTGWMVSLALALVGCRLFPSFP
jgi:hypothetical protein